MPTISFSGLASGIDSDAVIKSMMDARRLASAPLEAKIETNKKESDALEEFNTKLITLQDLLQDFMTLTGGVSSKAVNSSNEDAVRAVASSDAAVSSTTLEIKNLAKAATVAFAGRFDAIDSAVAPSLAGEAKLSLTVGSGDESSEVSVTINNTTTITDLVNQLNEAGVGKVQASLVRTGTSSDPDYALMINGLVMGEEKGVIALNLDSSLSAASLLGEATIDQAEDALLVINGLGEVKRPTNQISDLLPGLTLDLKRADLGPITLSTVVDSEKTAKKLSDLVEAINQIITYSAENDQITRVENKSGVTNQYGSLARTSVDDQAISQIKRALFDSISGVEGSVVKGFADLGVSTQRDGTLKLDTKVFKEALAKDPRATERVLNQFSDKLGGAKGFITEYTKFQGIVQLATAANEEENKNLNDRLERLERSLEDQKAMMVKIFANLETTVSKLNSSADALSGLLSGLATKKR